MNHIAPYAISIFEGAWITISVALLSLILASLFGIISALFSLSNSKILKNISLVYTTVIRGIPDLVLMLLIFYGGQIVMNTVTDYFEFDYFELNAYWVGVFSLAFIYGAFFSETFRGAYLQVDKGQFEAGDSLALTRGQILRKIILPQAALFALPSYINNWLVLLKATAILSLISVVELVSVAQFATRSTHQPFIFYGLISLIYLFLTWLSSYGFECLKNKYMMQEEQIL